VFGFNETANLAESFLSGEMRDFVGFPSSNFPTQIDINLNLDHDRPKTMTAH
jgi:hypothetical protein